MSTAANAYKTKADNTAETTPNKVATIEDASGNIRQIVVLGAGDGTDDVLDPLKEQGTWGYNAGTSGTVTLTGGKKVLKISAVKLGEAGAFDIDGGDTIVLPYNSTDKVSTEYEFSPKGNLVDPIINFTTTDAYIVEWVV